MFKLIFLKVDECIEYMVECISALESINVIIREMCNGKTVLVGIEFEKGAQK